MERIFGRHSVLAVFLTRPNAIKRVIILAGKQQHHQQEYIKLAHSINIEPEILSWNDFKLTTKLSGKDEKHQGICVFAEPRTIYTENDLEILKESRIVLALDQVTGPKNLATIFRSAAFFGVDAIILLKDRSADISTEVILSSMGGVEFVKIFRVINLARTLDTLKKLGYWVYGLDERGEKTLYETIFDTKTVFVVGAEGEGMRQRTKKFCDMIVSIQGGRKGLESLNVGVATSIALFEFFRQNK